MFESNNVIQPCILCGQPVATEGSCFCNTCSIFKDQDKLQAAVDGFVADAPLAAPMQGIEQAEELSLNFEEEDDGIILDIPEQ